MAIKPIQILINAKDNASAVFGSVRERLAAVGEAANSLAGRLAAAFTIGSMASAAAEIETLQTGLQAVSGSAEKAAEDMDFVRRMSSTAGADVVQVGRSFLSLSAATKGTAVEGDATRRVFEAVTIAMARAGKGSAETSNALQALAQMAGKGQVQMEELRGQLGEALPGALNAAAKGLGITTKELTDLVEQGQITAQDLFPALTKGLNDLYGSAGGAQTLSQELANVKNAFTDMAASIGDAGGLTVLKTGAEIAQAAIVLLGDTLVRTGKSIGVVMGALATWDFSGLKQSFADIEAEGRTKLLKAAEHNEVLRNALKGTVDASFDAALEQQKVGAAAVQAGQQAGASADNWIRLNNGYGQVLKSVRDQIAAQEKSVIAREAEGKASVALAAAFGTEAEKRDAQTQAAVSNAQALQDLAKLRQTELATLQAQLEALKQEAGQSKAVSDERAKQISDLEKQINLRQQDADKATAQAQAARLHAEQAKAEAEALKDNSARVGELRAAWEQAKEALEKVRAAKAAGLATTEQVTKAELAAGRAALVYRDAIQDQLRAIEAKKDLQRADLDLQAATVQLAIEQQRYIHDMAKARGDERGAMAAQNEMRRLEIELLRLSAEAKRAEAEASLATTQAKKAELIAAGQYTGAKKLEIDAAIKAAEVKKLEAQMADTAANRLRDLSNAQGNLKQNTESATNSLLDQAGALERVGDGVQRVGEGFRNKDGFTSDAQGNTQQQWVWTRAAIIQYLEEAGLDKLLAEDLAKQFVNEDGSVDFTASAAQKQWGGKYSTLAEALGKMTDFYQYGAGKQQAEQRLAFLRADAGITAPTTPAPAPVPARAPSMFGRQEVTVNLQINGQNYGHVDTDSDGARVLQGVVSELERAKRNTGR